MGASEMQIFEEFMYGSLSEELAQRVDVFNASSRGAITLTGAYNSGDFSSETFWSAIPNLMRRRDAYGAGGIASANLAQEAATSVKVDGGTLEVTFTKEQMTRIQKDPEEAAVVASGQVAKGMIVDYLNSGLRGARAAIGNNAALVHDGTASTMVRSAFVDGASKFGDRFSSIVCWAAHSKSVHDLLRENLANANRLFEITGVAIMDDGFGRSILVTDSPDLVTAGVPNTYHTLGLAQGGIEIEANNDFRSNIETKNGLENITSSFQAEYSFNLKILGYSWDKANGGKSPNDAALATGANWDKIASDDKNTVGVLVNTQ